MWIRQTDTRQPQHGALAVGPITQILPIFLSPVIGTQIGIIGMESPMTLLRVVSPETDTGLRIPDMISPIRKKLF